MLYFPGVRGVHPCVVKNIHPEGGACIGTPSYCVFAEDFYLSFDGFKSAVTCHVAWRNDHQCGVQFVERLQGMFRSTSGQFEAQSEWAAPRDHGGSERR
jgi:hypothetical protein